MLSDLTPAAYDVKHSGDDWSAERSWRSFRRTGDEHEYIVLLNCEIDSLKIKSLFGPLATGDEYGGIFVNSKVRLAGLRGQSAWEKYAAEAERSTPPPPEETLQSRAAVIARATPAVPVEQPAVPQLTGDLLDDARLVTGLTFDQIAHAVRVSGRAVAAWRAGTVPSCRMPFLQALRSIGISLVGGLGAPGVRRWFLAGAPSRLDRLAAGDVESVVAEARAYETSPAT